MVSDSNDRPSLQRGAVFHRNKPHYVMNVSLQLKKLYFFGFKSKYIIVVVVSRINIVEKKVLKFDHCFLFIKKTTLYRHFTIVTCSDFN